ncbi:MAG: gamma-glutamyl-gamma-aminobutyrate hydrolase family protein [Verrucomicrobiales bacterium]|nr:gamma-glutamyl-gamma-aminobutyrate hydrolase family protein [Verrucomicrobiales bacterium]
MTRRLILTAIGLAGAGVLGFYFGTTQPDGSGHRAADSPLIGIASLTSDSYVRAVREAGGIPVVLPNTDGSTERIEEYLKLLDGLLMPGGADIPPSEYGEEPHETVRLLDDDRFLFEKNLVQSWIEKTDKPMLGICLGCQWINVASGGSLVQDIPSEFSVNHRDTTHSVQLEKGSRLLKIFEGETEFEVNSLHHQAVRKVGKNLRVVARSPEGIAEAIEMPGDRFVIGVQWHPEKLLPEDRRQAKLIDAFIREAASKKN